MTILEDLWHGNVAPSARAVRDGSEYQKVSKDLVDVETELRELLNEEGERLFEDCVDKNLHLCAIGETDAFVKGFRLGAKMILEVMGDYPSQLPALGGQTT